MIVDRVENWQRWVSGPAWEQAFEFLQSVTPDMEEKAYELQGRDLYAPVMSYETRSHDEAVLEAHRRYVDIQTVIAGAEGIEWFPTPGLEVKTAYDAEKDVEFFVRPGSAPSRVDVRPGLFVLLFPEDAHMPQLAVGGSVATVKKAVVKVSLDLIGG